MFKLTNKIVYVSMKYFKSFPKFICKVYKDKSFSIELCFNNYIEVKFTKEFFWMIPTKFKKLIPVDLDYSFKL